MRSAQEDIVVREGLNPTDTEPPEGGEVLFATGISCHTLFLSPLCPEVIPSRIPGVLEGDGGEGGWRVAYIIQI